MKHQKTALILLFLILTVGIALAGGSAYRDYERQYRGGIERNLTAIAELKIREILLWRFERLGDGEVYYQNDAFSIFVENILEDSSEIELRRQLLEWLQHIQTAYDYDRIFLLDPSGNPVLSMPGEYNIVDSIILDEVRGATPNDDVHLLDFYLDPANGKPYLAVVIPVTDSATHKIRIATLVFRIDPEKYLFPYINSWPSYSQSAETLIVRREADKLVFLNRLRFRDNEPMTLQFSIHKQDLPAAMAVRGFRGITEGVDYRGVKVLAFVSPIPDSPWYIVARIDQSEVFSPIRDRLSTIVVVVAAMILCAIFLVLYLWRQYEAQNFREKYETAENLRVSEEKLAKVIRSNLISMTITDESGRFQEFNEAFCTFCGYSAEELWRKSALEIGLIDDPERINSIARVLERDESVRGMLIEIKTKTGETRFGQAAIEHIEIQGIQNWLMVIMDITSLKEAEIRVKKLNRVFAVLSDINQCIVRIKDETDLFERACAIAADRGAFQLAWIARVNSDADSLSLVACDGNLLDTPNQFSGDWEVNRPEWIKFLAKLREGVPFISNDLLDETRKIPWRFEALRDGLNSMAVYPLTAHGVLRGIFALYTAEAHFFDKEERQLLEEMAMDVSFSLEVLDQERDRQRMVRALEESEIRYRTVADHTYDWEYWLAKDGHLEYISPSCEWITGHSALEFIHHPELINEIVYPPDQAIFEDHVRLAQENEHGEFVHDIDFRIIHTDGEIRWIGHTCKHIFREDGTDLGIRATNRNITERKNVENALETLNAELEERIEERTAELSDLYHNAPCGYHSLDRNGIIVRINDTELTWFGYSREELVGRKKFTDLTTPESTEMFKRMFPVYLQQGWIKDLEFDVICKDGSIFPVLVSATALRNAKGDFVMSRSTLIDNSERKRTYQEIQELADSLAQRIIEVETSNRELENFAYSVSHDLGAPLRAIDGYTRIIQEDKADKLDEETLILLSHVLRNVEKINRMIQDLLTYSRINHLEMELVELDLVYLARTTFRDNFLSEVKERVSFSIGEMPAGYGDNSMILQVLANLIDNAVKFSQERQEPSVQVAGYEDGNECVYFVKDNGIGFDQMYAERLFEIFQRYHRSDLYEGNGIGLAIVQRIVERHGGRVWAEGIENDGATFFFSLPKKADVP